MIDETRRGILKMFGVGAAAVAMPIAAKAAEETVPIGYNITREYVRDYTPPPAPEGFTYQWKRVFVNTETPDFENISDMIAHGWVPVPASRHPETYPPNGSYWVEIGGMVLMEKRTDALTPPRPHPMPWEHKEVKGWGGA